MSKATFNFLLDTLLHEIEMHEEKKELIKLLREQVTDDTFSVAATVFPLLQPRGSLEGL